MINTLMKLIGKDNKMDKNMENVIESRISRKELTEYS
jgi:hypothetical protein